MLLAVMSMVMPISALIPVHTVVQLGSGISRSVIMWRYVMRGTLIPFRLGAALSAFFGSRLFVSLPTHVLEAILGTFIIIVTWLPKLGRLGAERGRFAVLRFAATFLGMFVSATGTLVAPFVASAAKDRRNHAATVDALMSMTHIAKLGGFAVLGFAIGSYLPLMVAMMLAGAAGNWVGEEALHRTSEKRFRVILQSVLTVLALRLLWDALRGSGLSDLVRFAWSWRYSSSQDRAGHSAVETVRLGGNGIAGSYSEYLGTYVCPSFGDSALGGWLAG